MSKTKEGRGRARGKRGHLNATTDERRAWGTTGNAEGLTDGYERKGERASGGKGRAQGCARVTQREETSQDGGEKARKRERENRGEEQPRRHRRQGPTHGCKKTASPSARAMDGAKVRTAGPEGRTQPPGPPARTPIRGSGAPKADGHERRGARRGAPAAERARTARTAGQDGRSKE